MSHEAYEELISAQLDDSLSPEEEAELEAHLATCPRCRRAKAELKAIHRLMLDAAAVPPPGLTKRITADLPRQRKNANVPWGRRIAPLAAAAVVALVVIGVVKPSFNSGMPREESSIASEAAVEEESAQEEAIPETLGEQTSEAEESTPPEVLSAGTSDQIVPATYTPPPQTPKPPAAQTPSAQTPAAQTPAAEPSNAKSDAEPQAEAAASQETAAQEEETEPEVPPAAVPASEPAPAGGEEPAALTGGAEPAPESKETDEFFDDAGGDREEPINDMQPSSTLTWQQARDRLCEYLGEVPEDLTAQDMSADGESWLFTTKGKQYAVDRLSGAVTLLSGGE